MSGKQPDPHGDTLLDAPTAPTLDARTLVREPTGTIVSADGADPRRPWTAGESEPRYVEPSLAPPSLSEVSRRYTKKRVLGEGGMGEVHLTGDGFVGREVAMKVVRSSSASADARSRFLREARVQGQLEHPSIVPVYDIGTTPDGELYFTMKRISGSTLEEIVDGLRSGDPRFVEEFGRRRLLSVVSQVCLTLAYAHARGVVHRDLKPANVMLGGFGEVYVLDWGIAKVRDMADLPASAALEHEAPIAATQAGALLGTPGYMAPEQARGEAATVDGRADVYALGVILYEILTLEPLHRGRSVLELVAATVTLPAAHPAERSDSLPPELDDLCARATAQSPDDRFAGAREMHAAIERFLDGERDLERRRALAESHAEEAAKTLASLDPAAKDAEARRVGALRSLGAALALDPDQKVAQRALVELLVDDAAELPEAAEKELLETNLKDRARSARASMFAYASWLTMGPIAIWMGVRSWSPLVAIATVLLVVVVFLYWASRTGNVHPRVLRNWMPLNFVAVSLLSAYFGPLVIVPQVAVATAANMMVGIRANALTRRGITIGAITSILLPLGLSFAGVLPKFYTIEPDRIVIHAIAVGFPPIPTLLLLVAASVYAVLLSMRLLGQGAEAIVRAERQALARAWRLRQMFPSIEAPTDPS
jgi:serine/threonine-protein kinase